MTSLVPAGQAYAHAELMSTSPAAGRAVAPPAVVTLRFDDVVQLPPGALRITGPHGSAVPVRGSQPNPKTLQGSLPRKLAAGRYSVRWRIVADDGHTVSGVLRFSVRAAAKRAAPAAAATARPAPPSSRDGGTATVLLTLLLSLVTIVALGVGLVRLRRERVAP